MVSKGTLIALLVMCAVLGAVAFAATRTLAHDRAALVRQFSADQLVQVQKVAQEIQAELEDVGEDLRFTGQLVHATSSAVERERSLRALLAVVKQYRLVAIYDADGRRAQAVVDPLAGSEFPSTGFDELLGGTARRALARSPGQIETSPPLSADGSGWFRAFAMPLPQSSTGSTGGAVAVLVDTSPFFSRLKLIASEQGSRQIVLGSHGRPTPATDQRLVAFAERPASSAELPALSSLLALMRSGAEGTLIIGDPEARRLGLGAADAVAAYVPIPIEGGGHWSVATISSTLALRAQQQALVLRLGIVSSAITLCLLGFAIYVVVTSRRAVAIRERLRHAEELAHLHEKTEKILDNVPTGVMALSGDGHITALNRMLRERVPRTAIGSQLGAAFPTAAPETLAQLSTLLEQARALGRVKSLLGERMTLLGCEGYYTIHAVPLEPRFQDARQLLVIEDVTELHLLTSQLLRAEKLATVGVLAAGIAHEIGTPMGIVRARAELLATKLGEDHPQTQGALVIVDQIDRVTRTIRQLLDFSRPRPAELGTVSVAMTAHAVVELLQFEAGPREVSIGMEVPEDLPPLAANPDQLQQVLVNLVMNACDACAVDGRVTIRATADDGLPDRLRIEVIDNGCGIAEELRHQVFDPFFTTKKRGKGTGLGLTIAAQIVRNHGGRIDLDSEPGQGTRVTVVWPTNPPTLERMHANPS